MAATPTRTSDGREPSEIVRSLVDDTQLLIRKHLELARHEIVEAVDARVKAAVAGAIAGVVALFAVGFLASAAAFGLDTVMAPWLSRIIVGGALLLVAAGLGLFMRKRMTDPPMTPMQTKRVLEEDRQWARTQLGR